MLKIVENEFCSVQFAVLYTFMWCCVGVNCQVFIKRQLKKSISGKALQTLFLRETSKSSPKNGMDNGFEILSKHYCLEQPGDPKKDWHLAVKSL